MSQLTTDCLNEIFEHLEDANDVTSLYSCLLVNRLWCKISVRFLWRDIRNFNTLITSFQTNQKKVYIRIK